MARKRLFGDTSIASTHVPLAQQQLGQAETQRRMNGVELFSKRLSLPDTDIFITSDRWNNQNLFISSKKKEAMAVLRDLIIAIDSDDDIATFRISGAVEPNHRFNRVYYPPTRQFRPSALYINRNDIYHTFPLNCFPIYDAGVLSRDYLYDYGWFFVFDGVRNISLSDTATPFMVYSYTYAGNTYYVWAKRGHLSWSANVGPKVDGKQYGTDQVPEQPSYPFVHHEYSSQRLIKLHEYLEALPAKVECNIWADADSIDVKGTQGVRLVMLREVKLYHLLDSYLPFVPVEGDIFSFAQTMTGTNTSSSNPPSDWTDNSVLTKTDDSPSNRFMHTDLASYFLIITNNYAGKRNSDNRIVPVFKEELNPTAGAGVIDYFQPFYDSGYGGEYLDDNNYIFIFPYYIQTIKEAVVMCRPPNHFSSNTYVVIPASIHEEFLYYIVGRVNGQDIFLGYPVPYSYIDWDIINGWEWNTDTNTTTHLSDADIIYFISGFNGYYTEINNFLTEAQDFHRGYDDMFNGIWTFFNADAYGKVLRRPSVFYHRGKFIICSSHWTIGHDDVYPHSTLYYYDGFVLCNASKDGTTFSLIDDSSFIPNTLNIVTGMVRREIE